MNKGMFATPESLGTAAEFRLGLIEIRPLGADYLIRGHMSEGEEIGGVFTIYRGKDLDFNSDTLPPAEANILSAFLKLVMKSYADQQGYTGVVIT